MGATRVCRTFIYTPLPIKSIPEDGHQAHQARQARHSTIPPFSPHPTHIPSQGHNSAIPAFSLHMPRFASSKYCLGGILFPC